MECSQGTIGRIKAAETYQEYLNQMAAEQRAYKAKKKLAAVAAAAEVAKKIGAVPASDLPAAQEPTQIVEHRQSVTVQATHYMEQQLKQMNETLKLISNKLAFVVMELTGKGDDSNV